MKKELSLLDRIGGVWEIMRILSIIIVVGLITSQSIDIYALYTDLIYIPKDSITLSWAGVDNPEFRFYIVEIEDTPLISHGFYKKGATTRSSMKADKPSLNISLQNNHSYVFGVRAVFADGSVSEALENSALLICELPPDYIPPEVVSEDKTSSEGGNLVLLESIDVRDAEDIRPTAADMDNDGLEDMVIGMKDGTISYYKRGKINGNQKLDFEYPRNLLSNNQILDVGDNASPFVYDYDKDRLKDLFVGTRDSKVILYKNVGAEDNPQFDGGRVLISGADDPALGMFVTVCVTDWNNDGKYDLVTGNDEGYVNIYINKGSDAEPSFGAFEAVKISDKELMMKSYTQPLVYDWNGDGKKDLLVS
ncbi:VCBS repeat-containing protein, partial [bacterium]|nr:VCBS repeat-containing protein [bacterium]